ncbi:hypothetical protein [Acinetobacter indicus]|uniref:hypothetical protein n=1 Tax=Acinetobacter indicus TaxID=756892 RepID=UPI0014445DEC|nr:hypothetical protein [Acinetobacter indicus]
MKAISLGGHSLMALGCVVIFLFFFIFGIPTPIGSLTPILTAGIIFFSLFNYKKYFSLFPREFFYLFLFLLFDLLVCLVIPVILDTFDFFIIKTKINFIISMFAVYILAKYFSENSNFSIKDFFNLLLSVFALQTIIMVVMLVDSNVSQTITSFTRSTDQGMRILESYAGARGLGVADSSVFGLAIVMGLFLFLTFFCYKNKFINFNYFILLLCLGSVASISAGRTAVIGLICGFLYLFINFKNIRAFYTLITISFLLFSTLYFLLGVDRQLIENQTLGYFYSYSMEPILNYMNQGELSSTSTDALHAMYFPLTEQQFLIGDGRYMDGQSYYMKTDAGYMRFALFYGVVFSSILYFYFVYFLMRVSLLDKKYFWLLIFFIIMSFIFHYKGETVLFAVSYGKLLFLIVFYIYLKLMYLARRG